MIVTIAFFGVGVIIAMLLIRWCRRYEPWVLPAIITALGVAMLTLNLLADAWWPWDAFWSITIVVNGIDLWKNWRRRKRKPSPQPGGAP